MLYYNHKGPAKEPYKETQMKTTFRDLFIANGFVENGLLFERKLKSPVNPDATAKITISIFHKEFSAVVENYFGTNYKNN